MKALNESLQTKATVEITDDCYRHPNIVLGTLDSVQGVFRSHEAHPADHMQFVFDLEGDLTAKEFGTAKELLGVARSKQVARVTKTSTYL